MGPGPPHVWDGDRRLRPSRGYILQFIPSLARIRCLALRNYRARRLGFVFGRSTSFRLPASILVAGTRRRLLLPDETGVRVAFIDILLDDCYRLRPLAGRCTTVLDVGAHAGLFTLAARMAFPGARIHAYEPNAAMRRYLEHQAEIADATIHLEAVGREAGAVSLARHPDSVRTRTLPDAGGGVPQVAFATALERLGGRADLVKLDCEGAEWEILRDGVAWRSVGRLTMEYHIGEDQPARSHEDARAAVRALGFTVEGQERVAPTYGLLRARRGVA